jgi:hypothetical protein
MKLQVPRRAKNSVREGCYTKGTVSKGKCTTSHGRQKIREMAFLEQKTFGGCYDQDLGLGLYKTCKFSQPQTLQGILSRVFQFDFLGARV